MTRLSWGEIILLIIVSVDQCDYHSLTFFYFFFIYASQHASQPHLQRGKHVWIFLVLNNLV